MTESKGMRHQWRVNPRSRTRELTWDCGVVARPLEKVGARPEGRDNAAGNGTGRFDSDLSMLSIVDVYPTRYLKVSRIDLTDELMAWGARIKEYPAAAVPFAA